MQVTLLSHLHYASHMGPYSIYNKTVQMKGLCFKVLNIVGHLVLKFHPQLALSACLVIVLSVCNHQKQDSAEFLQSQPDRVQRPQPFAFIWLR